MALLQRHCVSYCSSAVTFSVQKTTLQSTQRAQLPKRFSICCASSRNTASADVVLSQEPQNAAHAPIVFKDDSSGVVCYNDENGDVTCEGWDEGPYFEPAFQHHTLRRRRRFTPSALQGRSGGESVSFKNVEGRMGASLGKEANESLESSEL